ncbi:hypothetical protein GCM10017783_11940 [Deinococcus piscis]|uniref:Uncharacterized protein n=1 Tax=Deinococcus piscis TaxID=394230 RepID=A0ABQ3K558_9DEIO|nr:hypothetical protein [Deinococcus piscis]GHG01308.1 hypothetical protein GCM10017783_11940 [Deinococcus piscis]
MLESSPTEFAATYAQYAAHGQLLPRPEGSFLLEFVSGDLALYLLDRCGPYLTPGPARVVIHGLVSPEATGPAAAPLAPWAEALGRSGVQGVGRVLAQTSRATVVDAGLPLVLSHPARPPYSAGCWTLPAEPGDWLRFSTSAPLHGYLIE